MYAEGCYRAKAQILILYEPLQRVLDAVGGLSLTGSCGGSSYKSVTVGELSLH